jgi:hypothetical protein
MFGVFGSRASERGNRYLWPQQLTNSAEESTQTDQQAQGEPKSMFREIWKFRFFIFGLPWLQEEL